MIFALVSLMLLIVTSFMSTFGVAVGLNSLVDVFNDVETTIELPLILEIVFTTFIGYLAILPGMLFYFILSTAGWKYGLRDGRIYILAGFVVSILNIEGLYVFDIWYKENVVLTAAGVISVYLLTMPFHTLLLKRMEDK